MSGSLRRIRNVVSKEWALMSSSFASLLYVVLFPLLITGQALLIIWLVARFVPVGEAMTAMVQSGEADAASWSAVDSLRLLLVRQFDFFLLIVPAMIANVFSTQSIVEEKVTRTLEPLLATPVRTWELVAGKALSGAVPAVISTWVCAGAFLGALYGLGWGFLVPAALDATWLICVLALAPAVAVLSFVLGVIGSSRAADAKGAQNVSIVIFLPIVALIVVQVTGLVWFSPAMMGAVAGGFFLMTGGMVVAAVRLFARESIVIRWR